MKAIKKWGRLTKWLKPKDKGLMFWANWMMRTTGAPKDVEIRSRGGSSAVFVKKIWYGSGPNEINISKP